MTRDRGNRLATTGKMLRFPAFRYTTAPLGRIEGGHMKRGCAIALSILSVGVLLALSAARVRGDVIPADWMVEGHTENAEFGTEIAAGDYNGDGYIDVLI